MARRALSISAVLVHYRTPALLAPAIDALHRSARSAGATLDCLVVDNGSDPEDQATIRRLDARVLRPGHNLGYAGGVNLGVAQSHGQVVLLMNPDVVVDRDCLGALLAQLDDGADVVAPRCFLDPSRTFLQPPTERRTRASELATMLASAGIRRTAARQAWRRHAWRHWTARAPVSSHDLSGAILAFGREVWQRVGAFDEAYTLYFEETDWLQRVARSGLDARWVPMAEVVHLHAQSTRREPRAAAWFEASHRRFRRRWYGVAFTALLENLARVLPKPVVDLSPAPPSTIGAGWLELAADPIGFPAAARRLGDEPQALGDCLEPLRAQLPAGRYPVREVDVEGRERWAGAIDLR